MVEVDIWVSLNETVLAARPSNRRVTEEITASIGQFYFLVYLRSRVINTSKIAKFYK